MGETICASARDASQVWPRDLYWHGIRPGESDFTLCGLTPATIFVNIPFEQVLSDVLVCPICRTAETSIKCPLCDDLARADDLVGQAAHMEAMHPEEIERRRAEAARWDGWEDG